MTTRRDIFPFAPLDSEDEKRVVGLCGGVPTPLEGFRSFLAASGYNGLPLQWIREYISTLGADCLEALDVTAPSAPRNFNRGALLYAGVASEVSSTKPYSRHKVPPASPLPFHRDALQAMLDTDRTNLAVSALQEADEIPSFGNLMNRFGDLFMIEDGGIGIQAARLGAGLLHLIVVESENATEAELRAPLEPDPTALLFARLEYDPSLDGLGTVFDSAEWPD